MTKSRADERFDAVLVGGGLQNALIALAVLHERPSARIALVERGSRICGEHTWSFHERDVPDASRHWVAPLVVARWSEYEVRFPQHERTLHSAYATTTSGRVASVVADRIRRAPGSVLLTGAAATQVDGRFVRLQDGTTLTGDLVVDARGPDLYSRAGSPGFQKFLGVEFDVESPAPFTRPVLMDARVPQLDGFHFFYVLPLSQHRVLVEDTYFSDSAALDVGTLRERVVDYAMRAGLAVRSVVREEMGVLPLPVKPPAPPEARSPLLAGYAGGWFHPGTGYSFPVGLRLAAHLARSKKGEEFGPRFAALVAEHRRQFRFSTFLNRMLFGAFDPDQRFNVLERFYRLPQGTIERFYALETTAADRLRILCGRPPRGMRLPQKVRGRAPALPGQSNSKEEGLSR